MKCLNNAKLMTAMLVSITVLAGCTDVEEGDKNYYWLDESFGDRALNWVGGQNVMTLERLGNDPRMETYRSEAEDILTHPGRIPYGNIMGDHIYNYWQDRENIFGLWRRSPLPAYLSGSPEWETLLDLDALSRREGKEWFFHGAQCRAEASGRCLVRIAHKSQDTSEIREFDLATKGFVEGGFTLPEGKSRIWWESDDTVIVAANTGAGSLNESDFPKILRRWTRGTPVETAEVLFETEDGDAGVNAAFIGSAGSGTLLAVRSKTFSEREYWMISPGREPLRLPLPNSFYFQGVLGDQVLMRLNRDWHLAEHQETLPSGALIGVPLLPLLEKGEIGKPTLYYQPSEKVAIMKTVVVDGKIYLELLDNYRSRIVEIEPSERGWVPRHIPLGDDNFIALLGAYEKTLLLQTQSLLNPERLLSFDLTNHTSREIFAMPEQFDSRNFVTELLSTTSKDGTPVSYTIMHHRDVEMDGSNPTLVYGYGGFDVSITPRYEPVFGKLWLEKGGIYVHAYLRGGGEFGPAGHFGAQLENRQQPYDDMAAIIQDVQARGFTSAKYTGIMGRSNGGLMVAVVMEQQPELMNAVVIGGPLIDMLHYQELPPGASWTGEYGDPREPAIRKFIETYSPQQNLKREVRYPTPLIITSTWDDRVLPGHARRFAAKLKAYDNDVLYFEDVQGGHYWELAGGPPPGDWRLRSIARAIEFTYLARRLGNDQASRGGVK